MTTTAEILAAHGVDIDRLYQTIMDELWADLHLIQAAEEVEDGG